MRQPSLIELQLLEAHIQKTAMAAVFPANQVIVVGGGLAGMSAANTVVENGGRTLLLDKSSFCGGNSTKATSGINGAGTKTQKSKSIPDNADAWACQRFGRFGSGKGIRYTLKMSSLSTPSPKPIQKIPMNIFNHLLIPRRAGTFHDTHIFKII